MARDVRVEVDQAAVEALLKSSAINADMTRRGEKVLDEAARNAPVDTGAYKAGLHLEQDTETGGVRVAGNTDHDWYVEADTGNLARALDAAAGDS